MGKEEGESRLRLDHSVGGPYVLFKSLSHIGDSVTCWVKTPAYCGDYREPSSRWGLTCRNCEGPGERGLPLGAVLSMARAGSLRGPIGEAEC